MSWDWNALDQELAHWRAAGLALPLWWRDDDAVAQTDALDQLGLLSAKLELPVHLAVIPKFAGNDLVDACRGNSAFIPIVHGWAHANHTSGQGKKAEFGTEREKANKELADGLARIASLFGPHLLRMFVPPWNRIAPEIIASLPKLGYATVSTFKARPAREAAPGLAQINCHVDPIHWRGGGGLVDPDLLITDITRQLRERRVGETDAAEPFGFLTHHLVHNPEIWTFTESCLKRLLDGGATRVNLLESQHKLP